MSVLSRINGSAVAYWLRSVVQSEAHSGVDSPQAMYKILQLYYENNGLYDELMMFLYNENIWKEGMKPLRNPAFRVVEFYAAKVWGSAALERALPIVMKKRAAVEAIQQVWTWSNLAAMRQVFVRNLATLGDGFIKVTGGRERGRVYFQRIMPQYVTEFETEERGFLTMIRVDVPVIGKGEFSMHTEVWDKESQTWRIWRHGLPAGANQGQLGTPSEQGSLLDLGIDFVPFVHCKFRDIGEPRGVGAFTLQLDKIDEVNRQATRLHQMLYRYNKSVWALEANQVDASGRPLPAPKIQGSSDNTVAMGDDELFRLPGNSKLSSLVPDINYEAALAVLEAQMSELEKDLPELAYAGIRQMGKDISGRAVRLLLGDAVDRVLEVRANAEAGLVRANQMALTIGQAAGLFKGLGSFEAGDFEHEFAERDVFPLAELEKAEIVRTYVQAGTPIRTGLRRAGWSEEEIRQVDEDQAEEAEGKQAQLGTALLEAMRYETSQPSPQPSPKMGEGVGQEVNSAAE